MNALVNKVTLIGQLGNNPEVKTFENGKKVVNFNMATNESYKNKKGEKITDTQWHRIVAWGSVAGIIEQYVHKGERLGIEGRLTARNYQDKEGVTRYITEIVANDVLLLSSKNN